MEVQRVQYQQLFEPIPVNLGPEETTLDRYWRPASEPKRFPRRNHAALQGGMFATSPLDLGAEEALISKWWMAASEPKRNRPSARRTPFYFEPFYEANTTPLEEITLDKWRGWWPDPKRRIRRSPEGMWGATHPVDLGAEFTSLDKWWQPASIPKRRIRRSPEGLFVIAPDQTVDAAETITLDKWWQAASLPTRRIRRNPLTGLTEALSTDGELITLDKWWEPPSEPKRRRRQAFPQGFIELAPDTTGEPMPDSWFALAQYRFRLKGRPRTGLTEPMSTDGELITLDKWFRATEQPYLRMIRKPWLLPGFISDLIDYGTPDPVVESQRIVSLEGSYVTTTDMIGSVLLAVIDGSYVAITELEGAVS
jgi:hypothetical protein